ncbi:MAG: SusD/RagB family nutrient-binding outer membrane lipoprotein, partial [Chitinophagaceae bacterium]
MKKLVYILIIASTTMLTICSCKKTFDELNVNENKPTSVPAPLLLNGVLNDMYDAPYTMSERWCQYYCCNYDYYGNNRYDFGAEDDFYSSLKNVMKMEQRAAANGGETVNPYEALGKFFRAYFFTKMSLQVGDIPMDDALKGL